MVFYRCRSTGVLLALIVLDDYSGSIASRTCNHSTSKELLQSEDGVGPNMCYLRDSVMASHLLVNGGSGLTKEWAICVI